MNVNLKRLILLLLIIWVGVSGYSQYRRQSSNYFIDGLSITPKIGPNIFYGDLMDDSRIGYAVGVCADREMHELLSARVQILGGSMRGTMRGQAASIIGLPALSFTNFYTEFTLGGTFRPLNFFLGYFKERTFQPYILLQGGIIYYNAKEFWLRDTDIRNWETDLWRTASGIHLIGAAGGGTTIWLNPRTKLSLEFYGTWTLGDELDAHKDWYSSNNPDKIYQTANNDFYYTATFGINFLINDSKFRNNYSYNRQTFLKNFTYFSPKSSKSKKTGKQRKW
ncbi:MAG: hypothetical protein FWH18_09600 [Marinilabiliaceae bacterium]|nr:hypothetical protein [Marinilabiliaceae bacterium]